MMSCSNSKQNPANQKNSLKIPIHTELFMTTMTLGNLINIKCLGTYDNIWKQKFNA